MAVNVINNVPYIKGSREFPPDLPVVSMIMTRAYIEIAAAINQRTIGLFPSNRPAITGNSYYLLNNQRQQSLRQSYTFTTTANITHNIELSTDYFVSMTGQFTDGMNWYGVIPGSTTAIAGQIGFYISPTEIIFTIGVGAPSLTKGIIVLEWLSQP